MGRFRCSDPEFSFAFCTFCFVDELAMTLFRPDRIARSAYGWPILLWVLLLTGLPLNLLIFREWAVVYWLDGSGLPVKDTRASLTRSLDSSFYTSFVFLAGLTTFNLLVSAFEKLPPIIFFLNFEDSRYFDFYSLRNLVAFADGVSRLDCSSTGSSAVIGLVVIVL